MTVAVVAAAVGGLLVLRASRGAGWSVAHVAAVAGGAILSRAVLAFAYYPVVGEISAHRKYAHNAAMLLLAAASTAYALRRAQPKSQTIN